MINSSFRNRILIKALIVGFVSLLMLIPMVFISNLIEERQELAQQAKKDVGNAWSGVQYITGPVISVGETHYLPDSLLINGTLTHQMLRRGIYPVTVYQSQLVLSGCFRVPILQNGATLAVGIADLRGIEEQLYITINGQSLEMEAGLDNLVSTQGLSVRLPASVFAQAVADPLSGAVADTLSGLVTLPFQLELKLKGSGGIYTAPLGKTSHVSLSCDYPSPSFQGHYLPSARTLTADGFTAQWDISHLTRNYGQQVLAADWYKVIAPSCFGVDLLVTASPYQQATRAVKYAILVILLTFVVVFFADIRQDGQAINVFQYLLSGLALVLFYALLVSLSEHLAFWLAYTVAAGMTTAMLVLYLYRILKSKKTALYVCGLLVCLYAFVYILLQMEDYALLAGSLGLFVILAGLMRMSTRRAL